jgi:hypothetical protein
MLALRLSMPVVSCAFTLMAYPPALALLGILTVAVSLAEPPLGTDTELEGVSVHVAAASAVASQLALMVPL